MTNIMAFCMNTGLNIKVLDVEGQEHGTKDFNSVNLDRKWIINDTKLMNNNGNTFDPLPLDSRKS